jgi:alkanesulfonate monooxygenase SsuD/methylene tetrahydromethanopterin reductase-like flavin-dependent oxidoreductase (luciferase family)
LNALSTVGTGGRQEDYRATGVDLDQKRIAVLESHVATMRRVWNGEIVVPHTLRPVEPFPVQEGGPRLLSGALGPKSTASAARWADGISGMTMSASAQEVATHLTRYFNWLDPASRKAMVAQAGFRGSAQEFRDLGAEISETGANELLLIPTSIDPHEVDGVAEALGGMAEA